MQQYFGVNKENKTIFLNEKDYNHIKNVMKMKEKTEVYVVFDDIRYKCFMNRDLKSVTILNEIKSNNNKYELLIYVPFLSDDKMKYIFQKCTELGATSFVIVNYERCKYKIDESLQNKKLERYNKIIVEASEQCYRTEIPLLNKFIDVSNIQSIDGVNVLCSLDNKNVNKLTDVINFNTCCDKISLVFGPEGGLTEHEENIIESNGFVKTSLGMNVLRTETVPIFISSIIKYLKECD